MADKKTRRRERKLARSRARSREKSRALRSRRRGAAGGVTAARAAGWPVHEVYVSEGWHEQGPRVRAILSRMRDDGRLAAAIFDVDLRERGVVEARLELDWQVPDLQRELVLASGEEALIACEPELVVKLVRAGARHGEGRGHSQAAGLERAEQLFGDLDPGDCRQEILVGEEPPPADGRRAGGPMASIKRAFTGG